jgi:DNA-directed RNA polymerase sigma subunit (sigma70/sigma32)
MQEFPVEPSKLYSYRADNSLPHTPWEALMVADGSPQTSVMEMVALREIINDAIEELLTPLEVWVFNALFVERKSLRKLERELSIPKTTIARIRDKATSKLRSKLSTETLIQEYLER